MTRRSALVIDDEPQFLKLMERALGEQFTILTAEGALDGYAITSPISCCWT